MSAVAEREPPTEADIDHGAAQRRLGRRDIGLTVLTFAALLALWTGVTGSGLWEPLIRPIFLPSPVKVVQTFLSLVENGYQGRSLAHHVGVSLYRFGTAFLLCILIGVPVGLLMGTSRRIRAIVEPPIQAIRPIPKLALLPLFLIWFGIGNLSKIVVIAAPVFPLIAISAMQAVKSVSVRKVQAARSLGASPWTVFRRILLPASLPGIFTGIRVSISIAVTMLVGAELTATSDGIAWMTLTAAEYLATDVVLVGVLIMAAVGYTLDRAFLLLETSVVHWTGKD